MWLRWKGTVGAKDHGTRALTRFLTFVIAVSVVVVVVLVLFACAQDTGGAEVNIQLHDLAHPIRSVINMQEKIVARQLVRVNAKVRDNVLSCDLLSLIYPGNKN